MTWMERVVTKNVGFLRHARQSSFVVPREGDLVAVVGAEAGKKERKVQINALIYYVITLMLLTKIFRQNTRQ